MSLPTTLEVTYKLRSDTEANWLANDSIATIIDGEPILVDTYDSNGDFICTKLKIGRKAVNSTGEVEYKKFSELSYITNKTYIQEATPEVAAEGDLWIDSMFNIHIFDAENLWKPLHDIFAVNFNSTQYLTDLQKSTARSNIGAISQSDITFNYESDLAFDITQIVFDNSSSAVLGQAILGQMILA